MSSLDTTNELQQLLEAVANQKVSVTEATKQLAHAQTIDDLGFAKVDLSRQKRNGYPEVIYGAGKTADQIIGIIGSLKRHAENILCTRVSPEKYAAIQEAEPTAMYCEMAQCVVLMVDPLPTTDHYIAVVTAGTSDMAVAEEAAVTAEVYGNQVKRIYDVGVAGIHRLF
ncbi:AIR carboxylase family protein, partial [Latilactobacillus curvatus]